MLNLVGALNSGMFQFNSRTKIMIPRRLPHCCTQAKEQRHTENVLFEWNKLLFKYSSGVIITILILLV